MDRNHPLNWRQSLAFGSAAAVMVAMAAVAFRGAVVSTESNRWARHTVQVLGTLQDLILDLSETESACRDYIISGSPSHLGSYRAYALKVTTDEAALRAATLDNPRQASALAVLTIQIAAQARFDEAAIKLRQATGLDTAVTAGREVINPNTMVLIKGAIDKVRIEESRQLTIRSDQAAWRSAEASTVLIIGTITEVLIIAAAGWRVRLDSFRRHLAEEALRESEMQWRMLVHEVQDYAICMLDLDGRIVTWNEGAERITGYTAAEIVRHNFSCFYSHEDNQQDLPANILKTAIAAGRYEAQRPRVRKDGSQFIANVTVTALHDRSGNPRGFSEITRDLSETEASAAKYRGLLEAAPDAMVVVNQSGAIVLLNVEAERQFGYPRDELLGQQVKNIIPEGFAERLISDGTRSTAEALAQQIGTGIELYGRRKSGGHFPIEIMLSPLQSTEGILITAAIRDISVRKAAEKHLLQMEKRYRGLLEAAPDAMVVVNQAGDVILLNVQAEKQFGYSRNELLGQPVTNIIPEGFAERLIADGLRSAEDASAQQIGMGIELIGRSKTGGDFPIEIMLSPLESTDGILVTSAIRDITTRKRAEAQLLQKVEELKRSNQELEQFAYIASHDLREPLRMVSSFMQLLSRRYKGKLDSDADEFIAYAVDGVDRMERLIQGLLAYSRVGAKMGFLHETSSEHALLRALTNLTSAINAADAQVTHDRLPSVFGDEMQLTQLFQNLVGNAIKYQNTGTPRVHISAAKSEPGRWMFSVQDNGLGIEPQYFERIFGMFQRLHKRDEFSGTGIGLAICKKIVEQHGGSISVESSLGHGSTFRFALAEGATTS
jgi:PAS domain S-box-containing protein